MLFSIFFAQRASAATQHLWVGETYTCDATSSVMGLTSDVSWTTNGGYFSMSGSGFYRNVTVTQYFSGTATIKCSWKYRLYSGDKWTSTSREWTISCNDNPCSISPTSMTLAIGESDYVGYSLKYSNSYTSAAKVYYSSSNSSIAEVDENTGKVTARGSGTTYITCYSKVSANSPYCTVTVKDVPVTSATITSSANVLADDTKQLSLSVSPSNATIKTQKWTSKNTDVVRVSNTGVLTGVAPGSTTVYCTVNGSVQSNNCNVTVSEPDFVWVSSNPANLNDLQTVFVKPSVTYSLNLYKGDKFSNITLTNQDTGENVSGNVTLNGKTLTFTPNSYLPELSTFVLTIPENALKNKWGTHYSYPTVVTFKTGGKESIVLEFSPKPGIIDAGTSVSITSNIETANIYYTTNGDNPSSTSSKYQSPIVISESTTIKAIGILEGYNSSEIITGEYSIAELESVTTPKNGDDAVGKNVIPCVKFNKPISASESVNDVRLTCNNTDVSGTVLVQDSVLYFVPENLLDVGMSYTFHIPENAIQTLQAEPNKEISVSFSTGKYAISVATNGSTSAIVMSDGNLWTWGDNYKGYCGDGTTTYRYTPVKIMDNVSQVDFGDIHGIALKKDGTAWTWGRNDSGELGDGTNTNHYIPVQIMSNVCKIAAGGGRSMFITGNKDLYICGSNYYGQIGDGTKTNRNKPVKVLSDVIDAATGYYQSAAVKSNGVVYTWGSNYKGALGGWPVSGSSDSGTKSPYKAYSDAIVTSVDCGENHTAILTNSGILRCAGSDASGQCGSSNNYNCGYRGLMMSSGGYWNSWVTGDLNSSWTKIAAGGKNTAALDESGYLYVCGENENGMVGVIGGKYLLDCDYLGYIKLTDVSTFDIGDQMGIAVKTDGSVWTWGKNDDGQLGTGSKSTKETIPVKIMDGFSTTELNTLCFPAKELYAEVGQSVILPTVIEPYNSKYDKLVWNCENKDIADVLQNGIVTAKSVGETTITVNAYNGSNPRVATYTLHVKEATGIGDVLSDCKGLSITQKGMTLNVEGLKTDDILTVYSTSGILIHKETVKSTSANVAVPHTGIYIISRNNDRMKIIVR